MNLPILGRLKDGVKFDFATLADNVEQTEEFLEWWWREKGSLEYICRPEVIADDDQILEETVSKQTTDLVSYRLFYARYLFQATASGALAPAACATRAGFREQLLGVAGSRPFPGPEKPKIIF